ncbi:MAG: 30S ribosome-binding factor RbfA [Chloroherpetonaceae bacterium]|nr:30S ribosome-binding factor RbfA [Chloroherpetonaceae bacterium]
MSIRTERVAELLQRELGTIFERELPRNGGLTTIVNVKVTPDLGIARFYLSVLGSKDLSQSILEHLRKENKHYRKELAFKIRNQFRRIPELEFYLDDFTEQASRIDALLKEARKNETRNSNHTGESETTKNE